MTQWRWQFAACLALLLASCALPLREAPPRAIWDVRAHRFVSEAELAQALAGVRFRLLGERHDNPAHHQARARLIAALAATGARPSVVFEQFDVEHDDALRAAQAAGEDAERVAEAGKLARKSWAWPLHKPIVEAALAVPLPVRAGNLARVALRNNPQATLDGNAAWTRRLHAAPWPEAKARALERDIVSGHCDKLPAAAVPRIALAQRLRDAAMAQALVDAATPSGAILIAGNGHVRTDLGVPIYLHAPGLPGATDRSLSVGFAEWPADGRRASLRGLLAAHPGFDYLWITPPVAREDPCATMPATPAR